MTEIFVHVEDRVIAMDIEQNTLNGLKEEFDALCQEDEALKERRLKFAPTYSMYHSDLKANTEIKRKQKIENADIVYISWTPLQLNITFPVNMNDGTRAPSVSILPEEQCSRKTNQESEADDKTGNITCSTVLNSSLLTNSSPKEVSRESQVGAPSATLTNISELSDVSSNLMSPKKTNKSKAEEKLTVLEFDGQPGPSDVQVSSETLSHFNHECNDETSDESNDSKDDDWYGEIKEYYVESEWNKIPKYLKRREKNRLQLHDEQFSLGLTKTPFQPQDNSSLKLKKKKKMTSQKALTQQNSQPPVSRRASKRLAGALTVNTCGSDDADDPQDFDIPRNKRRANTKPKRVPGQELVGSKLMPSFSKYSEDSIRSGKPNMVFILGDIRNHIEAKCGSLYVTKVERDAMSKVIVKKYPQLADADDPKNFKRLSLSISASIRGKRNYENNVKPRREAAKKAQNPITGNSVQIVCQESEQQQLNAELLQAKVTLHNQSRIKFLIGKTLDVREVDFEIAYQAADPVTRAKECEKIWERYPHFKDGKLIIYEHCLRLTLKQEILGENFDTMIKSLNNLLQMNAENSADVILLLQEVYEQITPKMLISFEKKVTPPIEVKDEGEAEGRFHISTYHVGQAPCVLVTTRINEAGNVVLSRSYLKMYNTALGTIEDPTPCDVVLQLLSPYFIGNIRYPDAYKSFLRLLEKYVHGHLCCQTNKQHPHSTYTSFVRRLENCK